MASYSRVPGGGNSIRPSWVFGTYPPADEPTSLDAEQIGHCAQAAIVVPKFSVRGLRPQDALLDQRLAMLTRGSTGLPPQGVTINRAIASSLL